MLPEVGLRGPTSRWRIQSAETTWTSLIDKQMNVRFSSYVPALAGLICGVLSTVPVELRFVPAMLLWGGVGLAIGLLVRQPRDAVGWGGLYGLFLLVGFFGAHLVADTKALHNPLFDVLAVILTPVGALVAVAVGARLRPRRQQGAL
jgi:hypothetical protein